MARHESDREDLLREATALAQRAELQVPDFDEPVVVGFRASGAASVFVGADPVYQFNAAGELRRGYQRGKLIKADRGRLAALERMRSPGETALVRRDLSDEETAEYLRGCSQTLAALKRRLASGAYRVIGQAPPEADVVARIRTWLDSLADPIPVAAAPHAR